jgi:hypothetical protein
MRTISSPVGIVSLAVDSAGEIYALTQDGISVYAANASGNATPIRQIPANATTTTLEYPTQIALDSGQNIYAANATDILVFSPTANGNVAPARTITWSNAGGANGVAVDAKGDIFTVIETCTGSPNACITSSQIFQFAPGANGTVTPTNALTILPSPSFPNASTQASGVALDSAGNLYTQVFSITSMGLGAPSFLDALSLEVFTPGQTGSSVPAQTITSTAWTLSDSWGLAVR